MKRKPTAPIRTAAQLRTLASPVVHDLLQALRTGGPATIADLGPRVGRPANSLHYHVRKLVQAGFVRQVGTGRSGARVQAIYDVVAERFVGPSAPQPARLRALTVDLVAALLRRTTRDFARATADPASVTESGPTRNIVADRHSAWLTPTQLGKANRLIDALHDVFTENAGTQQGQLFVLTTVLTPAPAQRKDKKP
jgi:DNA-binding Lrp family transcriptional regulator